MLSADEGSGSDYSKSDTEQPSTTPSGAQASESAFSTSPTPNTPVSTAGVGSGGTGGWTNIQSYLTANAGNSKSSDVLRSTVGGQFDKEDKTFTTARGEAEKRVQPDLDRTSMSQDAASRAVQNAGNLYGYGSTQSDEYGAATKGLRDATRDYSGDTSPWVYATGAETQRYGSALNDNKRFQGLMGDLYRKAAGGQMGQGAMTLQRQIDQDNPLLNTARTDLTGQYNTLTGNIKQGVTDANTKIQNDISTVNTRAKDMRGYLDGTLGTGELTSLDDDVSSANQWLSGVGGALGSAWQGTRPGQTVRLDATPQTSASRSNIISPHRSNWNVIQDVLGSGGKINQDPTLDPSSINYSVGGHIQGDGWGVGYAPTTMTLENLLGWSQFPSNMPRPATPGYFAEAPVAATVRPNLGRRI